VRLVFGAMRDKAVEEVTNTLFPLAAEIILTAPNQPRALHPAVLAEMSAEMAGEMSVSVAGSVREAMAMLAEMNARAPMTTFVTGRCFWWGKRGPGLPGFKAPRGKALIARDGE